MTLRGFPFASSAVMCAMGLSMSSAVFALTLKAAATIERLPVSTAPLDPVASQTVTPLTLLDAINRALNHNPQTRQAWAMAQSRIAALGVSRAAYWPTVSMTIGRSRTNAQSQLQGIADSVSTNHSFANNRQLQLAYTLLDAGARGFAVANAKELLASAYALRDAAMQTVFADTVQIYYAVYAAQESVQAAKEAEDFAQSSFETTRTLQVNGLATYADELQTQTAWAQARLNLVKARGDLRTAQGKLAIQLGLDAKTRLEPAPLGDQVRLNLDVNNIKEWMSQAQIDHPKMLAAQANLNAAKANLNAVIAQGLPSLTLSAQRANTQMQSASVGQAITPTSASIGLLLTIPLFEGTSRLHQIKAADAQVALQEINRDSARLQLSLEMWTAFQDWQTHMESLTATASLLASAKQSQAIAAQRYRYGVGTVLELLSSQSALATARQQSVQTRASYETAKARLAASLGRLELNDLE